MPTKKLPQCADATNGTMSDASVPEMLSVYFGGNIRGTSWSEVFQMLVARLPAANSHLQGVIRGEQSGQ